MSDDLNRLQIELDYGEIVNFNNLYYTFSASDENFDKHSKMLIGSLIALPVLLLKYHGVKIKTSEQFLKFPIIKKIRLFPFFVKTLRITIITQVNNIKFF